MCKITLRCLSLSADVYSNPLAPDGHEVEDHRSALQSKLTNDDFRKLLMTPRATPSSAPPSKTRHHEYFDFDIYL
ncbi:Protein Red [Anabarilius grahami]|uniref:Protein Red n=1 Tax=Anabarilius grahami TaxID=495550 RepID=A0A3N0XUH2_ANAGA|nr:Protein Red [Anabarilius grahami]